MTEEQIETDVELRLRKAGIKVVDNSEPEFLFLSIDIGAVRSQGLYAFAIWVKYHQPVRLVRDLSIMSIGTTWGATTTRFVGIVSRERLNKFVREKVADRVDEFINDYLAANPKK